MLFRCELLGISKFSGKIADALRTGIASRNYTNGPPSLEVLIQKCLEGDGDENQSEVLKIIEQRNWLNAPTVYCDGACDWNTKRGGIGIFWRPFDKRNVSLSLSGDKITSIRAEMQSVNIALLQAISNDMERIIIKSDSNFVVKLVNLWIPIWQKNGWKKADGKQISNLEDVMKMSSLLDMIKVTIEHIYRNETYNSHNSWEAIWDDLTEEARDLCGNYHADLLAKRGMLNKTITDLDYESILKSKLGPKDPAEILEN